LVLKTVKSHLNGLFGGGLTLFLSGTRKALGWLFIHQSDARWRWEVGMTYYTLFDHR
jgi:hypothetical protein